MIKKGPKRSKKKKAKRLRITPTELRVKKETGETSTKWAIKVIVRFSPP